MQNVCAILAGLEAVLEKRRYRSMVVRIALNADAAGLVQNRERQFNHCLCRCDKAGLA